MPRITVCGPIPYDHIETYEGIVCERYGCTLYPTMALAALLPPTWTIHPVANVGSEDIPLLRQLLSLNPQIDLRGIRATPEGTNRIFLKYTSQSHRLEKQTNRMKPITFSDVEPFLDSSAFIFVPVTDFEVTLDTLRKVKESSPAAIVLFDAHGPVTTIDAENNRIPKAWENMDEWLPFIDVLKMNDEEFANVANQPIADAGQFTVTARVWLEKGPSAVVVTTGSRGATVAYRNGGEVSTVEVPAAPVNRVVDTTGAGDSFAAGYVYGELVYKNPVLAAMFGNVVAAQKLQFMGPIGYKSNRETEVEVIFTYSSLLRTLRISLNRE